MLVVNISPLYFNVYNNYHTKHLVDINKISAKAFVNIKSILVYLCINIIKNIGLDIFISTFIQQY